MVIIPYIVLAAVAALFFVVSYFVICGFPKRKGKTEKGKHLSGRLSRRKRKRSPPLTIGMIQWMMLPALFL